MRSHRSPASDARHAGDGRGALPRPSLLLVAAALICLQPAAASGQAHQPPKVEHDDYAWQHESNPYSGDAQAVAEGRRLYRSTCYICHLDSGGRGPDLRKSKLKGRDFMRIVIRGRKGTQMPAWLGKLSEDQMWMILAYVEAPRN